MATMINLSDLINKANGKTTEEKQEAKKALKKEYKEKAAALHPDHGGNEEEMKKLNEEFAQREALIGLDDELKEAVEKILNLPGINIEICGSWIWVSGDTKAVFSDIKNAGYHWARKKKMWYYRKDEDAHHHRGHGATMAHIREKYGSEELKNGYSNARLTA